MDDLQTGLINIWSSDFVQKNPNKAYKVSYNDEYLAVAAYLNGGTRPNPTNYSKLGKGLVAVEDHRRSEVQAPYVPSNPASSQLTPVIT